MNWLLLLSAMFVLVIAAAAQNPPRQPQQNLGNMPCPMMGGGTMPGGMPQHQEMTKLMDQVAKSAAALEKETNPTALKKKVAEHAALVKQLQTQFQQCPEQCGQAGSGPMKPGPGKKL